MQIININGPINSGKTTISKLLAQELNKALFIEVDDLLSDEEQEKLGLTMEQGWKERTDRLAQLIAKEKLLAKYENIVFAYPIADNTYQEWKSFEDENTKFINITLAPALEVCIQNRGNRVLSKAEIKRIEEMYQEGYHTRPYADLIVDNTGQTAQETLNKIMMFLKTVKLNNKESRQ